MLKKAIWLLEQLSDKIPDWHSECDCYATNEMREYEVLIDAFLEKYYSSKQSNAAATTDQSVVNNLKNTCQK